MMSSRKIVDHLLAEVNRRNRLSTCDPKVREGWNSLLTHVLHDTGNYCGFRYLTPEEVPDGCHPGIKKDCGNYPKALGTGNEEVFADCDETRVEFFSRDSEND